MIISVLITIILILLIIILSTVFILYLKRYTKYNIGVQTVSKTLASDYYRNAPFDSLYRNIITMNTYATIQQYFEKSFTFRDTKLNAKYYELTYIKDLLTLTNNYQIVSELVFSIYQCIPEPIIANFYTYNKPHPEHSVLMGYIFSVLNSALLDIVEANSMNTELLRNDKTISVNDLVIAVSNKTMMYINKQYNEILNFSTPTPIGDFYEEEE